MGTDENNLPWLIISLKVPMRVINHIIESSNESETTDIYLGKTDKLQKIPSLNH